MSITKYFPLLTCHQFKKEPRRPIGERRGTPPPFRAHGTQKCLAALPRKPAVADKQNDGSLYCDRNTHGADIIVVINNRNPHTSDKGGSREMMIIGMGKHHGAASPPARPTSTRAWAAPWNGTPPPATPSCASQAEPCAPWRGTSFPKENRGSRTPTSWPAAPLVHP